MIARRIFLRIEINWWILILRYNNKTYRIDDIAWDKTARDVFDKKNGEQISFVDYYLKQYHITIKEPDCPLLVSKVKNKINGRNGEPPKTVEQFVLLIPELCIITGT